MPPTRTGTAARPRSAPAAPGLLLLLGEPGQGGGPRRERVARGVDPALGDHEHRQQARAPGWSLHEQAWARRRQRARGDHTLLRSRRRDDDPARRRGATRTRRAGRRGDAARDQRLDEHAEHRGADHTIRIGDRPVLERREGQRLGHRDGQVATTALTSPTGDDGRRIGAPDGGHRLVDGRVDDVQHRLGKNPSATMIARTGRSPSTSRPRRSVHALARPAHRPGHRALVHEQDVERGQDDAQRGDDGGPG
jgi:hypothetical protein